MGTLLNLPFRHQSLNQISSPSKFDAEVLYIDGVPLAQTKAILRRMCVDLVESDKIWRNLLKHPK